MVADIGVQRLDRLTLDQRGDQNLFDRADQARGQNVIFQLARGHRGHGDRGQFADRGFGCGIGFGGRGGFLRQNGSGESAQSDEGSNGQGNAHWVRLSGQNWRRHPASDLWYG